MMRLGWDSGCWGYVGYVQEERGHGGSWSCGPDRGVLSWNQAMEEEAESLGN